MRSPTYSDVFFDCCDFLANAGGEARKEFFARVNENINKPRLLTENNLRKASLEFSVDFSDDLYRLGDGYVYAYITNDGELFYIGCGQSDRVCNIYSRSENFKAMYELGASAYVLASNLHKINAEEIETLCVWIAQLEGCLLENSSKMLSNFELRYFHAKEKGLEIKKNSEIEKKWDKYEDLLFEYKEVADSFLSLMFICLDKEEFNKKIPQKREHKPSPDLVWTIDGETKTITEWCEQYGRSRGSVIGRINRYGFTPKQALTLPPVPCNFSRKPIEYWQSLGFVFDGA